MAEQDVEALVLKDTEGNYYVFDQEAFDRARVTDDTPRSTLGADADDSGGFVLASALRVPDQPLGAGHANVGTFGIYYVPPFTLNGRVYSGGVTQPNVMYGSLPRR